MSNEKLGGIFLVLSFLAFPPVFWVYAVNANKNICRATLILFLSLVILSAFFSYGAADGLLVTLVFLALPVPVGVIFFLTVRVMKARIERKDGSIGVSYSLRGTIANIYRSLWNPTTDL